MPTIFAEREPENCIYCDHPYTNADIFKQTDYNYSERKVECDRCHRTWREGFRFSYIFVNDDDYDEVAFTTQLRVMNVEV